MSISIAVSGQTSKNSACSLPDLSTNRGGMVWGGTSGQEGGVRGKKKSSSSSIVSGKVSVYIYCIGTHRVCLKIHLYLFINGLGLGLGL